MAEAIFPVWKAMAVRPIRERRRDAARRANMKGTSRRRDLGSCIFIIPILTINFQAVFIQRIRLPQAGELMDNRRNFDRDRLKLFDERAVYDTLLAEGVFETFANSYLIEAYG